ncbi:hypothetical protein [Flavobacterium sp. CS20]|uniref:hypothetical protein n=1 Tax=Flavobacterium sp. CS20 TaxID=2775246 RepID=UPI001FFD9A41|nr:hypothetical protein [Flavobacterium sp. CS20]
MTGKVNITNIGLTNKLSRINSAATTVAIKKLETLIPGRILAKTTTAIALSRISTSVFKDLEFLIMCVKIKKTAKVLNFFSSL